MSVLCQSLCRYCFGTAFGTVTGTVSVLFRSSVVPHPVLFRYCLGTVSVLCRTFDRSRKFPFQKKASVPLKKACVLNGALSVPLRYHFVPSGVQPLPHPYRYGYAASEPWKIIAGDGFLSPAMVNHRRRWFTIAEPSPAIAEPSPAIAGLDTDTQPQTPGWDILSGFPLANPFGVSFLYFRNICVRGLRSLPKVSLSPLG